MSSENTEVTTTKPSSGSTSGSSDTPAKSEPTQPAKTETPTESKPAETTHTHNWVAITETVTVTDSEATTRTEVVSAAWDETVVDKEAWSESHIEFFYDGYIPTSEEDFKSHQKMLMDMNDVDISYHSVDIEHPAETHVEHHAAVTKTVDVPAVTHTEERVVGYKCSSCGATK